MALMIVGKDLWTWHETAWPEGYVWEDGSGLPDGRDFYADDGSFALPLSEMIAVPAHWQMVQERPGDDSHTLSVETEIARWLKERETVTLLVTIPKAQEHEVRKVLNIMGWPAAT